MNVLVTGGSRGMGAEIVKLFAERGHNVAFVYRSKDEMAADVAKESGAISMKADISDANVAETVYRIAEMKLGSVDVLVNCAGVALIAQICDTDNDAWNNLINTNLTSTFVLCREASKAMVSRKKGSIINIGSVWGRVGASCETAYSASKSALRGFTMALAKELAPSGIRVNCVEPGVIETEMNSLLGEETLDALREDIPLGRLGSVREVAELVYFLAGESSSYITGQCIGIDGGFGL